VHKTGTGVLSIYAGPTSQLKTGGNTRGKLAGGGGGGGTGVGGGGRAEGGRGGEKG